MSAATSGPRSQRDVIDAYLRGCTAGDASAAAASFTEDCTYVDAGLGRTVTGRAGVEEFLAALLASVSDISHKPVSRCFDADTVCTEWILRATHTGDYPGLPATGRQFEVPGIQVDVFKDGLIHHHTDYWNFASALQQLGFLPSV